MPAPESTPAQDRDDFTDLTARVNAATRITAAINATPDLFTARLTCDLRQLAYLLERDTDEHGHPLPDRTVAAMTTFARALTEPAPEVRELPTGDDR
jgi:hypothetical protein